MNNNLGKNHYNWKGGEIDIICIECGKKFPTPRAWVKKGRKYCSLKCRSIDYAKKHKGINGSNWKGGRIKKICNICGKEFEVYPSLIKYGYGKSCSKSCAYKWRSQYLRGEKSCNWKGGKSNTKHLIVTSKKYSEWRNQIFIRDNFTCKKCGDDKGGNLNVHHVKRFSLIIDDIIKKYPLLSMHDIAINYNDLWDIKNGITLCKNCHKLEHKKLK